MKVWALAAALVLGGGGWGQWSEGELKGLDDALYFANLKPGDLNFAREGVRGVAKMPLVRLGLERPMDAGLELMGLHQSGLSQPSSVFLQAGLKAGWKGVSTAPAGTTPVVVPAGLPPKVSAAVGKLVGVMLWSDLEIRDALSKLSLSELRLLIESLPVDAVETSRVSFSFVKGQTVDIYAAARLTERVDVDKILHAGFVVSQASEVAAAEIQASGETVLGKVRLTVGGLPVVVAGTGADQHDEVDARLTIDLGGNDAYSGRHGAGVGYTGVLIDLGGDDVFRVPDLSVGAGVLGVGCAVVWGGDDKFRTGSLSCGAGVGGFGYLYKKGGHDTYDSVSLAQGFGIWGLGISLDTLGNDTYTLRLMGQGSGRTQGLGWLIDQAGTDTYRAGGLLMNSPLFATAHYSQAQGFGMGYREDTGGLEGGVGLLSDGGGNDVYWAETYAQAASYWFSVGSLYDASGQDSYSAVHYSQSSAMHMTSAYLFDLAGDDLYTLRVGAGQGVGHDSGVGVFLDRGGEDIYASRDARAGSGLAQGLGLFLDGGGVDKYTSPVGFGRFDRSASSLGIFVDLGGSDWYSAVAEAGGLVNGDAVLRPELSVSYDLSDPVSGGVGGGVQTLPPPVVGSKPMPSQEAMAELYERAVQWGVGTAEADTQAALRELAEIGVPALDWMLNERLSVANRLHIRAFGSVIRALGPAALPSLGRAAMRESDIEIENLLRIAVEARVTDLGAIIPGVLASRPALRRRAAQAAGVLGAAGAVDSLLPLLLDPDDPLLVRDAMVALELIGDRAAIGSAVSLLGSSDVITRRSAMRFVSKFPAEAFVFAAAKLDETDEFSARTGVEVLGLVKDERALAMLVDALIDPRPGVRISVLQALTGRVPDSVKEVVNSLKQDPIPLVRIAARRALP